MDTPGFDPEADLTGLEAALGRLRPASIALDRDRMLFEAGRASARLEARARVGYAVAAGFAFLAVGLGGLLARERSERRALEVTIASRDRGATSRQPTPSLPRFEAISPNSSLALTRRFLSLGLDGLQPEARKSPADSSRVGQRHRPEPLRVRDPGSFLDLL